MGMMLVFHMWPMLPYIGWQGHAWLTVLWLPDNHFCSGCTFGQACIISIAQGPSIPPLPCLCTTLPYTRLVYLGSPGSNHTLDALPSDPWKAMHWASSCSLASA